VPRQANETDREVVGGGRLVQLAERVDKHLETFPEASKKYSYASITFVFGRRKPSIENGAGLPFSDVARTLSLVADGPRQASGRQASARWRTRDSLLTTRS
jgi:hypothetical protein